MPINAVKYFIALGAIALFSAGCSTVGESMNSDTYSAPPYLVTQNSKGETVHVRERVKSPGYGGAIGPPTSGQYPIIYPNPAIIPPNPPMEKLEPEPLGPTSLAASTNTTPATGSGGMSGMLFLEHASAAGHAHLGVHLGITPLDSHVVPRLGFSFFGSNSTTFLGFDGSARYYLFTQNFRPFAGAGAYIGDTKNCTDRQEAGATIERCEKKFLLSGYVEVGLEYKYFSVFWRDYAISRAGQSVPVKQFFGIGLRF